MIDLGVRVEFYERVGEAGEPGAFRRNSGYRAVAVPAVGTHVMASSLRTVAMEDAVASGGRFICRSGVSSTTSYPSVRVRLPGGGAATRSPA